MSDFVKCSKKCYVVAVKRDQKCGFVKSHQECYVVGVKRDKKSDFAKFHLKNAIYSE